MYIMPYLDVKKTYIVSDCCVQETGVLKDETEE